MKSAALVLMCLTPLLAQVAPPSPGMVCMQLAPDGISCTLWVNAPHSFGAGVFGAPNLASFFHAPPPVPGPAPLVPISITVTPAPVAVLVPPPALNFSVSAGSLNFLIPGVAKVQINVPPTMNLPALIPPTPPSINFQPPQNLAPLLSNFFNAVFSNRPPAKP